MNARTVNISSLVLLLALLSLICEGFLYYFLPQHIWAVLFAIICSLILSHFFLETSYSYVYIFLFAACMTIGTLIYAVVVYLIQPNQWISYDFSMVFLVLVNWITPLIYCTLRDLNDHGPRFDGYNRFFRQMSILLLLIYSFVLIKQYYLTPIIPPYPEMAFGAQNFIPYMATGTYLEDVLRNHKDILPLACYLIEMICLYIPFGFYLRAYSNKLHFGFRLIIYLAFPALLEASQYATGLGRAHVDDYVSALLGTIIGVLLFHAINGIYHIVAGRDIASERNTINLNHFNF